MELSKVGVRNHQSERLKPMVGISRFKTPPCGLIHIRLSEHRLLNKATTNNFHPQNMPGANCSRGAAFLPCQLVEKPTAGTGKPIEPEKLNSLAVVEHQFLFPWYWHKKFSKNSMMLFGQLAYSSTLCWWSYCTFNIVLTYYIFVILFPLLVQGERPHSPLLNTWTCLSSPPAKRH